MSRQAMFLFAGAISLMAAPASGHDAVRQSATTTRHPTGEAARARAVALVARMSLDEKIALLHGLFPPAAAGKTPNELIPSAGHIDGIPRLGIPIVRETDASLGVANQIEQRHGDVATALPSGLSTAASFDPAIAYAGGAMIGSEARAKRFNVMLSGGINLTRDPWNGRNFEYLGEDPLLAGRMGAAHIAGVQSNHIVSTIKHYVLNAQETGRMILDARIDPAALRMSDLLAFELAIQGGHPGAVMCAYNRINGDYACENDKLLTGVLKDDWHFPGWVMSDWGAVHSTARAANAGLDQESGEELDRRIYFGEPLKADVLNGRVSMARLDDMVARYLTGLIETGAFDTAAPAHPMPIDYAAHARVAERAADEGIVLLKNTDNILPIARRVKRIVLIGGHADVGVLSGGGSSQVRPVGEPPIEIRLTRGGPASFARITYDPSSPLRALRAALPGVAIDYVPGDDPAKAAAAARSADLAIVFATQWTSEAEDVPNLSLPDHQDALMAAVAAAQPHTVAVMETGGPVLMPWIDRVPAVLQAWYPGQRGGEAIAAILTGAVNPSGRLPITFPAAESQPPRPVPPGYAELTRLEDEAAADPHAKPGANPTDAAMTRMKPFAVDYVEGANVGYRWYEQQHLVPLFPFGHGLSYTRFAYRNLKVVGGRRLSVAFDITNMGRRTGADVPQLYVGLAGSAVMRLAGFQRIRLAPRQTRHLVITAEPRIIADFDARANDWRIAGGHYHVAVGHDATDRAMTADVVLAPQRFRP